MKEDKFAQSYDEKGEEESTEKTPTTGLVPIHVRGIRCLLFCDPRLAAAGVSL